MRKTKEQKGITLIALIITIIVLLILAVVAIGAVQNDGIINHAKNARDGYEKAQVKENEILNSYLEVLNENLEREEDIGGLKELAKVSSIGDFVEYDSETTYNGMWIIFDIDEDGYVYLTSDTQVETWMVEGKSSYLTYSSDLNSICDIYLNTDFAVDSYAPKREDVTNISDYIDQTEVFWIDEQMEGQRVGSGGTLQFYSVYTCGFMRKGFGSTIIFITPRI